MTKKLERLTHGAPWICQKCGEKVMFSKSKPRYQQCYTTTIGGTSGTGTSFDEWLSVMCSRCKFARAMDTKDSP